MKKIEPKLTSYACEAVAVWCAFETAMKAQPTIMVSTEQILAPGDRPRAGCGKGCAMRPARILRAAGARR